MRGVGGNDTLLDPGSDAPHSGQHPSSDLASRDHLLPQGEKGEPDPDRLFRMAAAEFLAVNPNTGTAPTFRSKRDAELTKAIYARLPVLVNRSGRGEPVRAWPVAYSTMFHMTNDSALFWTREALDKECAYPAALGRWRKGEREWLPLYVGRMIHHFDHRAASVTVNEENVHNAAGSDDVSAADKADPGFTPTPQYWVEADKIEWPNPFAWGFAFRDIARSTDERTAIGTIVPRAAFGNTAPLITSSEHAIPLWACFSSFAFDYVCRQKAQSTHLNWYIVEQLPVIPPEAFDRLFGSLTARDIVRDHVLRLSYTAWDLEALARDMGHVDAADKALPPFRWDETERRHLRARLDALFFHLYGMSEDEARTVLSTFPIVRRKDEEAHGGVFLTEQLVVWYMRALLAGDATSEAPVATLLRQARAA